MIATQAMQNPHLFSHHTRYIHCLVFARLSIRTALLDDECIVDRGEFKGGTSDAYAETTRRLQPLRGYRTWTVLEPWKGVISIVFHSCENAEQATVVLRGMAMASADGKWYRMDTKDPVPKNAHLAFAPKTSPREPPKRDSAEMKIMGLDNGGDHTMDQTDLALQAAVTPEAKRYRQPDEAEEPSSRLMVDALPSSGAPCTAPTVRDEPGSNPGRLPVAIVLRFEQIEREQSKQGAAIATQGKQRATLETKINDTWDKVGVMGDNVRQMVHAQQEHTIKNSRELHTVVEMDMVGPRRSMKKPKQGAPLPPSKSAILSQHYGLRALRFPSEQKRKTMC